MTTLSSGAIHAERRRAPHGTARRTAPLCRIVIAARQHVATTAKASQLTHVLLDALIILQQLGTINSTIIYEIPFRFGAIESFGQMFKYG